MENPTGCVGNLVVIITALITGFLGYFSAPSPNDATLDKTDYPFVLVEGGANYSFIETFNCNFVIAGNVEFLPENSIDRDNIVIMIQSIGTYDDRPPATVLIGNDRRFGENGWSQLLIGKYWYRVWVHDLALNTPLSSEILVDDLDCANERILAQVNFRQIRPFG